MFTPSIGRLVSQVTKVGLAKDSTDWKRWGFQINHIPSKIYARFALRLPQLVNKFCLDFEIRNSNRATLYQYLPISNLTQISFHLTVFILLKFLYNFIHFLIVLNVFDCSINNQIFPLKCKSFLFFLVKGAEPPTLSKETWRWYIFSQTKVPKKLFKTVQAMRAAHDLKLTWFFCCATTYKDSGGGTRS